MNRKKVKQNNLIRLIQILLFTTIVVVCYSLSKFYTASAGDVTAIIGKPIVTSTLNEIVLENLQPGASKTYRFVVSNYNADKVSDIEMTYTIEIKSEKYLPLIFELRKVENNARLGDNLLNNNITEPINMGKEEYMQEYELTIKWDENEKNYKYSDEIDCVEIMLNSYQLNVT